MSLEKTSWIDGVTFVGRKLLSLKFYVNFGTLAVEDPRAAIWCIFKIRSKMVISTLLRIVNNYCVDIFGQHLGFQLKFTRHLRFQNFKCVCYYLYYLWPSKLMLFVGSQMRRFHSEIVFIWGIQYILIVLCWLLITLKWSFIIIKWSIKILEWLLIILKWLFLQY